MATVSTYLNFNNQTEEAFEFYRSVFGGKFSTFQRFADVSSLPEKDKLSEEDLQGILHIALPIIGGHTLRGTEAPESMGFKLIMGNNVHISLELDTRAEADRLFVGLSAGGSIEMGMEVMFWGDYFGSFSDKYGVNWMINCSQKK